MPDVTISATLNQLQRVSSSYGPKPAELTHEQWISKNVKADWKQRVKAAESTSAANVAFDAAHAQADADFAGF